MKFAFDMDGVITEAPDLFKALTSALRAAGHEIYIVTDFDEHFRTYREAELARLEIVYDHLVITSRKQQTATAEGIDYAFDDDAAYYPAHTAVPLFLFTTKSNNPVTSDTPRTVEAIPVE